MATFILATGTWHGSWCYRDTAKALRDAGHTVFTPTYTCNGNGDPGYQANQAITLEAHAAG